MKGNSLGTPLQKKNTTKDSMVMLNSRGISNVVAVYNCIVIPFFFFVHDPKSHDITKSRML